MIYISAMEAKGQRFDLSLTKLLDRLTTEGHRLFWNKSWRQYEQIEKEIAACDALVAIVDSTWTSSTWMASEVTWALGLCGAIPTSNPKMTPIPVLLYPVDSRRLAEGLFPFGLPGTCLLDRNVSRAVEQVNEAVSSKPA